MNWNDSDWYGIAADENNFSALFLTADEANSSTFNDLQQYKNSTNSTWEESFLDSTRFWFQRVLVPIVVMVGVMGNLVTIYILTRRPMRSSTNVYLCALAVSDLLFLLFSFSMSFAHYPVFNYSYLYWSYRPVGLWLTDAASSTSVWLTVSFTIERYIAVCHPMRGKVLCTEERAIKVAIAVYFICFAVTSPTPFEHKLVHETSATNETVYKLADSEFGQNETYRMIFHWFSSVFFVLLPVVILAILNFILIMAVRRSRILRKQMTQNQQPATNRQMQTMRQENRITITLIGVVIVFLICQVPTALVLIYTSVRLAESPRERFLLRVLGNVFNFLVCLNAACNFLLYTALSDKYRKYFCAFLRCWSRRGSSPNNYGFGDQTNACELDTLNTTFSLTRAASLRMDLSPSRNNVVRGSVRMPDNNINSYGNGPGLRRAQTCHAANNSKNHSDGSNNSTKKLLRTSDHHHSGSSFLGFKHKGANNNPVTSRNSIHINLKDASIPLIQVDSV